MKPSVLVIGPTPPPLQGMSVFTEMLVRPGGLDRAMRVVHLETADRRSMENMGRLDLVNVWLAVAHAVRLLALIVRHRPGVVYIGVAQNRLGYLRDAVFIVIARATGRRVVTHLHGSALGELYRGSGPVMRWVIRRTSRMAARVAVLSPSLAHVYDGLVPPDRVRAVAAGVADRYYGEPAPTHEGPGDAPAEALVEAPVEPPVVVGYLGLFYRPKGFVTLLEAAAELHGRDPGRYRFILAGDWFSNDERTAAARIADREDVAGAIEAGPPVEGAAKRAFLEGLDLLVFPGHQREGLPLVVLEAMAAARPVVATPVGAIPDVVVPGETGLLVPPGDVSALADAIERMAADPAARARMGRAGRMRFLEHYTEERCIERMVELLTTR